MLDWYENCYVGKGIRDPQKVIRKVDCGKGIQPNVYLVTLSDNPGNMLEIISAMILKQEIARSLCPKIVGIAKGKDEAVELVQEILTDTYKATGTYQAADFLKNR